MKHIRNEHSTCNPSQSVHSQTTPSHLVDTPRSQKDINNLATHLFALSLTDNGPDQHGTANKLWESHMAYQDTVSRQPHSLPVSNIIDSLSHLTLHHQAPPICPPDCGMALVPDSCSVLNIDISTPFPPSQDEQSDLVVQCPASVIGHGVSKKDANRHLVKALELLSNIEKHCQHCFRLLLDSSNTPHTALQEEDVVLHHALEGIKCNTTIMNSHKKEVMESLWKLDAELWS